MQMVHCLRDTTSHPWFQNEAAPDNRIGFRLVASQTQRLRSPPLPPPSWGCWIRCCLVALADRTAPALFELWVQRQVNAQAHVCSVLPQCTPPPETGRNVFDKHQSFMTSAAASDTSGAFSLLDFSERTAESSGPERRARITSKWKIHLAGSRRRSRQRFPFITNGWERLGMWKSRVFDFC